jgi:hypothetical protein
MKILKAGAPILFLLLVPPILIEVLSGNTPPTVIFQPLIFMVYLIVYGFPIILIADTITRWHLSLRGILILGYAYGLYNEAIIAKTVFAGHVLAPAYNGYGELFGLNFPWLFSILTFHAFLSVLFPILLAQEIFPKQLSAPFLSNKIRLTLLSITGILGYFLYIAPNTKFTPPFLYFWIFIGLIGLLIVLTKYTTQGGGLTKQYHTNLVGISPALWGFIAPALFLVTLHFIASYHAPVIYYFLFSTLFLIGYGLLIMKKYQQNTPHLLVLALGNYIGLALIGILFTGMQGKFDVIIWNTLSIVILITIIIRYRKKMTRASLQKP